jgi:CubicO group peptidase (beta-lactamase class C family)
MRLALVSAFVLALAAAPALAAPAAADQPQKTASGATFTQPKAWELAMTGRVALMTPPEPDTHVVIVDVGAEADARTAVDAAWAAYKPNTHPLQLATPLAARNGWDERQAFNYETSPNEKLAIQAVALRSGKSWTVVLIEGGDATMEKRAGAMGLISQSLRPAGYARENFADKPAHRLDAARIETMKNFVRTAMEEIGVPGVGLAFVDHGKVVYEGGLGVRELGKPQPVDAHTLFMIASNTKGMSTLLLSELVDEGKLKWDQPVTEVYPSFRLGSDATTKKVLIRHLVCACTGLPRKDYDWIFNTRKNTPASTTFTQLAATEPTSGFGEVFQYNNLMASAAGYIGGKLVNPKMELGAAYDSAIRTKVFEPLGMRDTTLDMAKALAGDHASPHSYDADGNTGVADMDFNYTIVPYRPAGGAWSSPHDLIRYVQDEIAEGVLPNGKRLVSKENLLKRREPNVPIGEDAWYGMGLEVDKTWGVTVIHHGGSMSGFKSDWIAVPSAEVGAVLLTNSDEGQLMLRPFMRRLLEVLYDGKPEAEADVAVAAKRTKAAFAKERERMIIPPAPAAVGMLAAGYTNPDLGVIRVKKEAGWVTFDFGMWSSRMASRKNDDGSISFVSIDPGALGFELVVDNKDGKRRLISRDGQHEYIYVEAS